MPNMLERLIEIRDRKEMIVNPHFGICNAVWKPHELPYGDLTPFYEKWPEFSGDPNFPIPDPTGKYEPDFAYTIYSDQGWDPNHPYGAARLRLLDFLIQELSK